MVSLVSTGSLGALQYRLPASLSFPADMTLLLTRDLQAPSLSVCANGERLSPESTTGLSLLNSLKSGASLLSAGLTIGARSDAQRSANATLSHLWLVDAALPCSAGTAGLAGVASLQAAAAANSAPVLAAVNQSPQGDVFVGDAVQLSVSAKDPDGDDLR